MPFSKIDPDDLFRVLPSPFIVLDQALRFVLVNEAYLKTTGRSRDDLIGRYVFDAFPESPERLAEFGDAFRRGLAGETVILENRPFSIERSIEDGGGFEEIYWTCIHAPVHDQDGHVTHVVQHAQDVTARVRAERRNEAITAELDHRVRNILTMIRSVCRRTARSSDTIEEFMEAFENRLEAIGRTHSLLTDNNWDGATLRALLEAELAPYMHARTTDITLEGGYLPLTPRDAQTLALTLHELATNAAKYGALSGSDSELHIDWARDAEDAFSIRWAERNIEIGQDISRRGFGTIIIDEITADQLGGSVDRAFGDRQMICTIKKASGASRARAS